MELPSSLARWSSVLTVVRREVAHALGPWLSRLAQAVGALRAATTTHTGDPDGYDGLTRRGAYERVLISEWLLAAEVPEEFVRRAAMGELGFHRLAFRETAKAKTSVALFDAGASQLGTPRLAQLAVLLLLAQRARDAGARFGWGVLQRPPDAPEGGGGLRLDVTVDNINGLLSARQALPPGDGDLAAWAAFEARGTPWDDLWIVGAHDTWARWRAAAPRRSGSTGGCVTLEDVLTAGVRQVEATVHQRSTVRALRLDLPDDATCTRLLRTPVAWRPETAPAKSTTRRKTRGYGAQQVPATQLLIDARGQRVAWRTESGAVVLATLPSIPRDGRAKLRHYMPRSRETIFALGMLGRRVVVATRIEHTVSLYEWSGQLIPRDTHRHAATPWLPRDDEDPWLPLHAYLVREPRERWSFALEDAAQNLWRMDAPAPTLLCRGVLAATVCMGRLVIVGRRAEDSASPALHASEQVHHIRAHGVVLGASGRLEDSATEEPVGRWNLPDGRSVALRPDLRPLAIAPPYAARRSFGLFAQRGRTLSRVTPDGDETVFEAPEDVVDMRVNLEGSVVVCVTADGALLAWSLVRGEMLVRMTPESAS